MTGRSAPPIPASTMRRRCANTAESLRCSAATRAWFTTLTNGRNRSPSDFAKAARASSYSLSCNRLSPRLVHAEPLVGSAAVTVRYLAAAALHCRARKSESAACCTVGVCAAMVVAPPTHASNSAAIVREDRDEGMGIGLVREWFKGGSRVVRRWFKGDDRLSAPAR